MAYQGSAQSIGFRARTVIDPSKRMRQEAAQIKEQGRDRIQGMKEQASQQTQEMQRVSDLNNSNRNYELKALSKFSKTLNDTLQEQAEIYIEDERAAGQLAYLSQPPEAYAEDAKDVDEAYKKSSDLHNEMSDFASKAPTKEAESTIRSGSRYYKQGWDLAALNQAGEGFGAHLLTELQTSEEELLSPTTGKPFKIKEREGREEWDYAAAYIKQQYLLNNDTSGLSNKVRATKLLPKLNSAINTQRKVFVQEYLRKQNYDNLDSEQNLLAQALAGQGTVSAEKAMINWMRNAPRIYQNLGDTKAFVTARGHLKAAFTTIASIDPQKARELIPVIDSAKIQTPAGNKSLTELYRDEFSVGELTRLVDDESYNKRQRYVQIQNANIKQRKDEILASFIVNPPDAETRKILAQDPLFTTSQEGILAGIEIQNYKPSSLSEDDSKEQAELYIASKGEITEEEAKNFNLETYQFYKDKGYIVETAFGSANQDAINRGEKEITAALQRELDNYSSLGAGSVGFENAEFDAQKEAYLAAQALVRSGQLKEDGTPMSEAEAINFAYKQKVSQIEQENETNLKSGKYYVDTNKKGFGYYTLKSAPAQNSRERQKKYMNTAEYKLKANASPDLFKNELIVTDPRDLELDSIGRPFQFFYQLARESGGRYSAFDILNFQRNLTKDKDGNKLKPVELPAEVKTLEDVLNQRPELRRAMIANPSPRLANRTLRQVGGVSAANLLRAIGFKESSSFDDSNYKARNDDPATGNDTDPALGKYQMLWSNVRPGNPGNWGAKYGLGVKSTQQEFLNDGEYQESLAQAVMNDMLRQALKRTGGDVDRAIRQVAAEWYGGPDGVANYDSTTFGTKGGYDSMRKYTTGVLNYYKGM
tara:strand:- start:4210 stop:6837 length:2628 start_codon:yes stop_codon:yes gene_type:complete